jgi:hypothetical protein
MMYSKLLGRVIISHPKPHILLTTKNLQYKCLSPLKNCLQQHNISLMSFRLNLIKRKGSIPYPSKLFPINNLTHRLFILPPSCVFEHHHIYSSAGAASSSAGAFSSALALQYASCFSLRFSVHLASLAYPAGISTLKNLAWFLILRMLLV